MENYVYVLFSVDYDCTTLLGVFTEEEDAAAAFVPEVEDMVAHCYEENEALAGYRVERLEMNKTYTVDEFRDDLAEEIFEKYKGKI